ncbi:MAG TPA: GNAT family N-acetyltransferase [Candidatus Limnocylindrales bacterium]
MSLSSPATSAGSPSTQRALACRPLAFDAIPRAAWQRLVALTPAATPFSRWTVHRAWWDAYGETAHDQYLVAVAADAPAGAERDEAQLRAIVPLMHRHAVEPQDATTATHLRHHTRPLFGTAVTPEAKAIYFGAAYHTDYATPLAAAADLPALADALADSLAGPPDLAHGSQPWDVVDLRRLRADDPALPALERAFRERAADEGWRVTREREDVCPVVSAPDGSWDDYLATLGKKARHEIRRKWRRAEAAGGLEVRVGPPSPAELARFIELHQARFGDDGLFPATEGGARSRRFVERLAELEAAEPDGGQLHLAQVMCGGRLLFAALAFDDGTTCFLYNAGMDPHASALSPGIVGTAAYLRERLEHGCRRFDFLRGDEPYKYEWGARDEVIERLLIEREAAP